MSILGALAGYYDHLVEANEATPGYASEKITFEIRLDETGAILEASPLGETVRGKKIGRLLRVPYSPKRTSGIAANLLWDKTSYALGITANTGNPSRTAAEHEAFRQRQIAAIGHTDDPGLKALLAFLERWKPEHFETSGLPADILDSNVVFALGRLTAEYIHDRPAAHQLVARLIEASPAPEGTCLITGARGPIAITHPDIRGVRDAQSSGAAIVSFNQKSFTSYGKDDGQGLNAPVSEAAAFAYAMALNTLLANPKRHVQIGDATTVFWVVPRDKTQQEAAEAAAGIFAQTIGNPGYAPGDAEEAATLGADLQAFAEGRSLAELGHRLDRDTQFCVLGLAPNAARLSIRFWEQKSVARFEASLRRHFEALRLDPLPWAGRRPPNLFELAAQLAPFRRKANGQFGPDYDHVPAHLAGELARAVLTGGAYPFAILPLLMMRLRGDGQIRPLRVALIKAVLTNHEREVPVGLDETNAGTGYLLGRLFAVLESVQYAAVGKVNATIRDRYMASASSSPNMTFPLLLRLAQSHLSAARKKRPGQAVNLEKDIAGIMQNFPADRPFPSRLGLPDQGEFFVGFYQQQHELFARFGNKTESDEHPSITEEE